MGLNVNILKAEGQETGTARSEQLARLCVLNVPGPAEPDAASPPYLLVRHMSMPSVHLVPAAQYGDGWHTEPGMWTASGIYAATSDSRLTEAVADLLDLRPWVDHVAGAVAVHDCRHWEDGADLWAGFAFGEVAS